MLGFGYRNSYDFDCRNCIKTQKLDVCYVDIMLAKKLYNGRILCGCFYERRSFYQRLADICYPVLLSDVSYLGPTFPMLLFDVLYLGLSIQSVHTYCPLRH